MKDLFMLKERNSAIELMSQSDFKDLMTQSSNVFNSRYIAGLDIHPILNSIYSEKSIPLVNLSEESIKLLSSSFPNYSHIDYNAPGKPGFNTVKSLILLYSGMTFNNSQRHNSLINHLPYHNTARPHAFMKSVLDVIVKDYILKSVGFASNLLIHSNHMKDRNRRLLPNSYFIERTICRIFKIKWNEPVLKLHNDHLIRVDSTFPLFDSGSSKLSDTKYNAQYYSSYFTKPIHQNRAVINSYYQDASQELLNLFIDNVSNTDSSLTKIQISLIHSYDQHLASSLISNLLNWFIEEMNELICAYHLDNDKAVTDAILDILGITITYFTLLYHLKKQDGRFIPPKNLDRFRALEIALYADKASKTYPIFTSSNI